MTENTFKTKQTLQDENFDFELVKMFDHCIVVLKEIKEYESYTTIDLDFDDPKSIVYNHIKTDFNTDYLLIPSMQDRGKRILNIGIRNLVYARNKYEKYLLESEPKVRATLKEDIVLRCFKAKVFLEIAEDPTLVELDLDTFIAYKKQGVNKYPLFIHTDNQIRDHRFLNEACDLLAQELNHYAKLYDVITINEKEIRTLKQTIKELEQKNADLIIENERIKLENIELKAAAEVKKPEKRDEEDAELIFDLPKNLNSQWKLEVDTEIQILKNKLKESVLETAQKNDDLRNNKNQIDELFRKDELLKKEMDQLFEGSTTEFAKINNKLKLIEEIVKKRNEENESMKAMIRNFEIDIKFLNSTVMENKNVVHKNQSNINQELASLKRDTKELEAFKFEIDKMKVDAVNYVVELNNINSSFVIRHTETINALIENVEKTYDYKVKVIAKQVILDEAAKEIERLNGRQLEALINQIQEVYTIQQEFLRAKNEIMDTKRSIELDLLEKNDIVTEIKELRNKLGLMTIDENYLKRLSTLKTDVESFVENAKDIIGKLPKFDLQGAVKNEVKKQIDYFNNNKNRNINNRLNPVTIVNKPIENRRASSIILNSRDPSLDVYLYEEEMSLKEWIRRATNKDFLSLTERKPYTDLMCQGEWSYQKKINMRLPI